MQGNGLNIVRNYLDALHLFKKQNLKRKLMKLHVVGWVLLQKRVVVNERCVMAKDGEYMATLVLIYESY